MDPRNMTKEVVESKPLPIQDLLQGSIYYPACEFDGELVRVLGHRSNSFVYCDYMVGEDGFLAELDKGFTGYEVLAHRAVKREEYAGVAHGWGILRLSPGELDKRNSWMASTPDPFCHWAVFRRRSAYGGEHGPEHFSLLFVGGEGVETFMDLYHSNEAAPAGVAIIKQHGFATNWTDFRLWGGPFHEAVMGNPNGRPSLVAICKTDVAFDWPGFRLEAEVPYTTKYTNGPLEVWVATA